MADTRVLDTNVLIVASAADAASPFAAEATPVDEAELRLQVLDWLVDFEQDASRAVVLDYGWHIAGEYQHKLSEQDYGWLAIMAKYDRSEVVWVDVAVDAAGDAVLAAELRQSVTDRADRKMVAATLEALHAGHACRLVNACDTDWLDCEAALNAAGVELQQLLPDWIRYAHEHKHRP